MLLRPESQMPVAVVSQDPRRRDAVVRRTNFAQLFGHETSLLVPVGTMQRLTNCREYNKLCDRRRCEFLASSVSSNGPPLLRRPRRLALHRRQSMRRKNERLIGRPNGTWEGFPYVQRGPRTAESSKPLHNCAEWRPACGPKDARCSSTQHNKAKMRGRNPSTR